VQPAREARCLHRDDQAADDVAAEHLDDEAEEGVEAQVRDQQRAGMTPDAGLFFVTFSPTLAFVLLAAAVIPFAGAIARYLRRPA